LPNINLQDFLSRFLLETGGLEVLFDDVENAKLELNREIVPFHMNLIIYTAWAGRVTNKGKGDAVNATLSFINEADESFIGGGGGGGGR
jgi:hypothetical protein